MPKIIENLRGRLLEEASRQVMEDGYSTMTIRSVAKACGVGVGTVYNYFQSKDMLVASFMLEDWLVTQQIIAKGCEEALCSEEALRCIYLELKRFMDIYKGLFSDEKAGDVYHASSKQRHVQLRSQLAQPLKKICENQTKVDADFLAEFLAESMLTWTIEGCEFEQIAGVLLQLL